MYCTQFDDWKAFSSNNYLRIGALKAELDFGFDLRTVKAEKESKRDKYYNIDSNNTVEPRLSGLVGTSIKSPDNRESG